jgi:hypothetical protein
MGLEAEVEAMGASLSEHGETLDLHGKRLVRLEEHPQACANSEAACREFARRAEQAVSDLKAENSMNWAGVKAHLAKQTTTQTSDILKSQGIQIAALLAVACVVGVGLVMKLDEKAIGVGVALVLGAAWKILASRKPTDPPPPAGGSNPSLNGVTPPGGEP